MEKYKVNSLDDITPELLLSLIKIYKRKELKRLNRLYDYYLGNTDVRKRVMADPVKPNNKIVNPYSSMITDTIVGYFMGKPISYQSEDKELMIKIQAVFNKNHEHAHNKKLSKKMTIMGVSYELLFIDEDSEISFLEVDPREVFYIYDTTVRENVLMAVRFTENENYMTNEVETTIYAYTDELIATYKVRNGSTKFVEEVPHYFGRVPIIQYRNNDDMTGSFEKVIDLINAYDLTVSDTQNNLEYFADAYLVITGAEFEDDAEVVTMKENRVMILPEDGKAEWLVKGASQEVEEFKNRLKEDIHTLSQIPNLGDESFGNATSGESLKYKLFGLENLVSITEGNFKESVEERIELVTNILNVKNAKPYDYTYITLAFTRNIPTNLTNLADVVSKLVGIISDETLYTLMPFIDDPALETIRKKAEMESSMYDGAFHEEIGQPESELFYDDGTNETIEV